MNLYAYNPDWPRHEAIRTQATRWHRRQLLTAEQLAAIETAYPLDFYRPHLFVRIGLFLFTMLGALASVGFVGLSTQFHFLGTMVTCLLIGGVVLESVIRSKQLYHSGADNALLYLELMGLVALIGYLVFEVGGSHSNDSPDAGSARLTLVLLLSFAVLLAATVRYADRLVAAAALLAGLMLVANFLLMLPFGSAVLPFALLAASVGAYRLVVGWLARADLLYYHRCLALLKGLTLATAYLSVNYLVVREGNMALLTPPSSYGYTPVSPQIPLAPLFYLFTAGLPLFYIIQGLRRPDRTWLWVGLLAAAFSIFTLRYYRSLLPAEIAATVAGALLTAFAVWATRYLRQPRHGLTSTADDDQPPQFNLESLIVAQTAHSAPNITEPGLQFGGGHSGGGGATGAY